MRFEERDEEVFFFYAVLLFLSFGAVDCTRSRIKSGMKSFFLLYAVLLFLSFGAVCLYQIPDQVRDQEYFI